MSSLKHCRAIYLESGLIQVGIVATISKDMAIGEKRSSIVYVLLLCLIVLKPCANELYWQNFHPEWKVKLSSVLT